ncbi:MAG: MutH/Sau3AI family endonuclease [Myxococcota bacterium]
MPTDRVPLDRPDSPPTLEALLQRARGLAGKSVAMLGKQVGHRVPRSLHGHKGFVGMCVELALGAKAKSSPEPDFPHLGVELKTIPVRSDGRPTEATHVCVAALDGSELREWRASLVYRKLARVLFVPIEDPPDTALRDRRIGMPWLWLMGPDEEAVLQRDWSELGARIRAGEVDSIRGVDGVALQLRPKSQTAADTTAGIGDEGWLVSTQPRAWYLRPSLHRRALAARLRARAGRRPGRGEVTPTEEPTP